MVPSLMLVPIAVSDELKQTETQTDIIALCILDRTAISHFGKIGVNKCSEDEQKVCIDD